METSLRTDGTRRIREEGGGRIGRKNKNFVDKRAIEIESSLPVCVCVWKYDEQRERHNFYKEKSNGKITKERQRSGDQTGSKSADDVNQWMRAKQQKQKKSGTASN